MVGGSAGCFNLSVYAPRILKKDFEPNFFVEHFVKDMEICLDESKRMGICLPGLALLHQLYRGLMAQGEEKHGIQAIEKVIEGLNGFELDKYDF